MPRVTAPCVEESLEVQGSCGDTAAPVHSAAVTLAPDRAVVARSSQASVCVLRGMVGGLGSGVAADAVRRRHLRVGAIQVVLGIRGLTARVR